MLGLGSVNCLLLHFSIFPFVRLFLKSSVQGGELEKGLCLGFVAHGFINSRILDLWIEVNLEYLGRVVFNTDGMLYPDSVVGTDSHTMMIDGLGVAGWGVGGIEAEATRLGQVWIAQHRQEPIP
ncbi:hypothetical protein L6452_18597 [Arctium lappa]|uniref:Uncharacterized protein n=1 Tax=Arctium lappa TaxID=4217 RepID=A0ACB9C6S0_ARCLA|nr:hypothetical protein L6452_18597 [Arctium lappa]